MNLCTKTATRREGLGKITDDVAMAELIKVSIKFIIFKNKSTL